MNMIKIISLIVGIILITASAFIILNFDTENESKSDSSTIPSDENENNPPVGTSISFNEAVNDFSFDFFEKLYEDPENSGNIFFSPYSVFVALAMTYEGARGDTAEEMENVLSIEQDNESFHEYMQSLYTYLNEDAEFDISTANAIWPRFDYELLDEYISIIEEIYGGKLEELDYNKPQEAADTINQWVEDQTNGLIKDLVPVDAITPLTMLILTNAIYFKGTWLVQFEQENTTDKGFLTDEDEIIQVPTMTMLETENNFNYTETEDMQILELQYAGDDLSMMIMLPKDGKELSTIVPDLDKDTYNDIVDSMTPEKVEIYLPKFTFKTSYNLNDYLKQLGMSTAFTTSADFSGINGIPDLYISKVLHKAHVEVNEEGTEAAAATAIIMERLSIDDPDEPQKIIFDADHPFLFTIHHKPTGTILFMGEVTNPIE